LPLTTRTDLNQETHKWKRFSHTSWSRPGRDLGHGVWLELLHRRLRPGLDRARSR